MASVSIRNACKSFPNTESSNNMVPVLQEFSLEVTNGEFVALFGPNGCGKSTLLNVIAGLDHLDSGTITVNSVPPGDAQIGYIFQNYRETLLPWKRTVDNITYPLKLKGISHRERNSRALRLLDDLDIALPTRSRPNELSGGQQQLLVIARALISTPGLLLFDEPFSALDFETRIQMRDKIQEIWQKTKATILFVSHELDEALLLADRVVMLSKRPARALDIIEVLESRPRTQQFLEDESFFQLRKRALRVFREELVS